MISYLVRIVLLSALTSVAGQTLLRGSVNSIVNLYPNISEVDVSIRTGRSLMNAQQNMALNILFTSLGGNNWAQQWNLSAPLITWHGVTLDNAGLEVVGIDLKQNNLQGSIPTQIGLLTSLASIDLSYNSIGSSIPTELAAISQLQYLSLSSNRLSNSIPSEIGSLTGLKYFYLHANTKIEGRIPDSIENMNSLKLLDIGGTSISGSIPSSICQVDTLQTMSVLGLSVCYPGCLEDAISNSVSGTVERCQDSDDLVLCELAAAFSNEIADISTYSEFSFQSVHPFNGESKLMQISSADISLPGNVSTDKIHSFSFTFDPWTDRLPKKLTVCSRTSCKAWTDSFPGITASSYSLTSTFFNLSFVPEPCYDNSLFGADCYGYKLTVKVYYSSAIGWSCSNPPPGASLPDLGSLILDYGIQLNESYAVGRCDWTGITCDRGRISSLSFVNLGLSGTIPSALFNLSDLTYVDVSFNHLSGTIPTLVGQLSGLTYLSFASNKFEGTLPFALATLPLSVLDASYNALTGTIPDAFVKLNSTLYSLDLSSNDFNGPLQNRLCSLNSIPKLDLSANQFDCIEDCWVESNSSLGLSDPAASLCHSVATSSSVTAFNVYYIIPIVIGSLLIFYFINRFFCTSKSVKIFQENEKRRAEILQSLPLHLALIHCHNCAINQRTNPGSKSYEEAYIRANEEAKKLISSNPSSIHAIDFDKKTAFDMATEYELDDSIILCMMKHSMPITVQKESVPLEQHRHAWVRLVQMQAYINVVREILIEYGHAAKELAATEDERGRSAISIATPDIQKLLLQSTYFHSRYEILTVGAAIYVSKTAVVHAALDRSVTEDTTKPTAIKVALKFFANRESFELEINSRQRCQFSNDYVVRVLQVLDSKTDPRYLQEAKRYGFDNYPDCLVLEYADRNLRSIARSEMLQEDLQQIRLVVIQLLKILQHVHSKGYIHGDLRPQNIVRVEQRLKLTDFDSAALISTGFAARKCSTAYIPPEVIVVDVNEEMADFVNGSNQNLVKNRSVYVRSPTHKKSVTHSAFALGASNLKSECFLEANTSYVSVKSLNARTDLTSIRAHPSYDVWALGAIVYELCAGITLFWQDNNDDIDEQSLFELGTFDVELKMKKMSKIVDVIARNFVHQMLTLDWQRRPSIEQLLCHPFITGQSAARLVGNPAEFDVFISYRVRSDSKHASIIYELLTGAGLRVWWDQHCLEPGLSWEDGFCDGLAKSRVFLPILSKGAIYHPTEYRQNFAMLTENSPTDNVLLEHLLSLELRAHGLIERIFPVMIGDLDVGTQSYGNYFATGCHPVFDKEVFVQSVQQNLVAHLNRQCLGSPLLESMSVSKILSEITKNQGLLVQGPVQTAFDNLVGVVQHMVSGQNQSADALSKTGTS